jgi:hypothetical protein
MRPARRTSGRRHPGPALALLAMALLAGAVAACGSAPSPSPAPASPPPATPDPAATPLPPGAFTFDLPDGWQVVEIDGAYEDLLAELEATNPAFAESLSARLDNLADSATFVAFDGSPEAVESGDLVTLTVTEVDLPPDVTLEAFAETIRSQAELIVEDDVELRRILVTAGEAYSLAYAAPLTRPDGQPGTVAVTQALYTLPGRGYVLTFAVPPDRANDYSETVADIATSFAIAL